MPDGAAVEPPLKIGVGATQIEATPVAVPRTTVITEPEVKSPF
jgi:hypothetical protein